eukprot:4421109-Pyramimonas_sp.AAC.1
MHCAAAFANPGFPVNFGDQYGFPKQKSFHYTRYGGMAPANILARERARQGNYFGAAWADHDCEE